MERDKESTFADGEKYTLRMSLSSFYFAERTVFEEDGRGMVVALYHGNATDTD
jgi:hypothetical protein